MFKVNDSWGIAAAVLSLIGFYLILNNSKAGVSLVTASSGAINDLSRTLQGR